MIVFDVVVNGERVETIRPSNQRPKEMYWFMVDRMHDFRSKYGNNVSFCKRYVYP